MEIKRWDNPEVEKRKYDDIFDLLKDAEKEAQNPETERLTLHFPRMRIPSRKGGRR